MCHRPGDNLRTLIDAATCDHHSGVRIALAHTPKPGEH